MKKTVTVKLFNSNCLMLIMKRPLEIYLSAHPGNSSLRGGTTKQSPAQERVYELSADCFAKMRKARDDDAYFRLLRGGTTKQSPAEEQVYELSANCFVKLHKACNDDAQFPSLRGGTMNQSLPSSGFISCQQIASPSCARLAMTIIVPLPFHPPGIQKTIAYL